MAHEKSRGTRNPRQNRRAVVVEVAEAEAREAEEAGDVAKENVSAQITMMIIAPLQMMNIWPPSQTQMPLRI